MALGPPSQFLWKFSSIIEILPVLTLGSNKVTHFCHHIDRVVDEISRNKISQNNSFHISQNFYVYFTKFHIAKYTTFCEIFAMKKFCFPLDEAKNKVAETEQEIAASFLPPLFT
jgi:hypothetical protein